MSSNNPLWELFIIVVIPIGSAVTWWIRGYIEQKRMEHQKNKDEKKQKTMELIETQIKEFYWPLYLNLLRYKKYSERYQEFRDGNLSLSSHESEEIHNSLFNKEEYKIEMMAYPPPRRQRSSSYTPIYLPNRKDSSDTQSTETNINQHIFTIDEDKSILENNKNIGYIHNPELDNNPKILTSPQVNEPQELNVGNLNKFDKMIQSYRIKMLERLSEIQQIYTTSTPKIQQDNSMIKLIIELDEYITYVTADSEYYEFGNKKVEKKFPVSIYSLIYRRLIALQEKYNEMVYGKDENDGIRINMTDIDNQQIQMPSIIRTIRHRRGVTL